MVLLFNHPQTMYNTPMKNDTKFIWIDLEMTGLEATKDKILEIALVITDSKMNVVEKFDPITIHHDLNKTKFNFEPGTHKIMMTAFKNSGLLDRIKNSKTTHKQAEKLLYKRIAKHCEKRNCYLAGNSVWRDGIFLEVQMPKVSKYLHYRNLDVTTLRLLREIWYPKLSKYKKADTHDAATDILESINQLKYLKKHLLK